MAWTGVRFLVAVIAAAVLGLVVGVRVLAMGLVVPVYVVGPLSLVAGSLAGAVGAVWAGNLFVRDRGRLLPTVAVASATAAVISLALFLSPGLGWDPLSGPLIRTAVVCVLAVAVGAGIASLRLRGPRGRLGADGVLALLASGVVLVAGVSVGGVLPGVPGWHLPSPGYRGPALGSLCLALLGLLMAAGRPAGRELGRDAAVTLALVAAILPAVVGTIALACAGPVGCGA